MNALRLNTIAALLLGVSSVLSAADTIDILIDQLEGGNDEVLPRLLDKQDVVLKRLLQRRPTGVQINGYLDDLGNDDRDKRKAATNTLRAMGAAIVPNVEAHLKRTDDPEVQFQCKELLKVLSLPKATLASMQRIKFLAQVPQLPAEVVKAFEFGYRQWMKSLKADEPSTYEGGRSYELRLYFAQQYALLPGSIDALCGHVLKYYTQLDERGIDNTFTRAAFAADPKVAAQKLIIDNWYLQDTLNVVSEEYGDSFTREEWAGIADTLLAIPGEKAYFNTPRTFRSLAPYMAAHSERFLKSDTLMWQVLGLVLYNGDWEKIRPTLTAMFEKAKDGGLEVGIFLNYVDPPKEERTWFLLKIMELTKSISNVSDFEINNYGQAIAKFCRVADPFPANEIIELIKGPHRPYFKTVWCNALLHRKPELTSTAETLIVQMTKNPESAWTLDGMLEYTERTFGKTFKTGHFDKQWLSFFVKNGRMDEDGLSYVRTWKISPQLIVTWLKKVAKNPKPMHGKNHSGLWDLVDYIYAADVSETQKSELAEILLLKVEQGADVFQRPDIYKIIVAHHPEKALPLLKKAGNKAFSGKDLGQALSHMLSSFHQYYLVDLVIECRVPLLNKLKALTTREDDYLEWFPYVCMLAMHPKTVSAHEKLLAKHLAQMIPRLTVQGHLAAALIASDKVNLPQDTMEIVILHLAEKCIGGKNYVYLLDSRYQKVVPKLVTMHENSGMVYPLKVALVISPDDASIIDKLKDIVLTSKSRQSVEEAANALTLVDAMPSLEKLGEERMKWIPKHIRNSWLADRTRQRAESLLKRLKKGEKVDNFSAVTDLQFQDEDAFRKLITPIVLKSLESSTPGMRVELADWLQYCSDSLEQRHLVAVHAWLKRERRPWVARLLLDAISPLGKRAAFMTDTVRKTFTREHEIVLRCLVCISPDPAERRSCFRELTLLRHGPKEVLDIHNRPKLTQPYWQNMLDIILDHEQSWWPRLPANCYYLIVSHLIQTPSEENFRNLRRLLKLVTNHPDSFSDFMIFVVHRALLKNYEERLHECEDLILSLPAHVKIDVSYWQLARRLRSKSIRGNAQ